MSDNLTTQILKFQKELDEDDIKCFLDDTQESNALSSNGKDEEEEVYSWEGK